ncbi:helix-turn-helix domain-containing protein [Terrarubrum flagellatum]|uniref:helix-turn-helix domain-containing protein n=1 Tax=Terrirubrum flagellatum TaxID=2895980 RepID=UPI0031453E00
MTKTIEVVRGSGNVFADFGDPDAEAKLLKARAATEIIRVLDERGLSVRAGAEVAKVDAADIQRIRSADLSRFTLDRLLRIAHRLGLKAKVDFVAIKNPKRAA